MGEPWGEAKERQIVRERDKGPTEGERTFQASCPLRGPSLHSPHLSQETRFYVMQGYQKALSLLSFQAHPASVASRRDTEVGILLLVEPGKLV